MRVEFIANGSDDAPLIRIFGTVQADFSRLYLEICKLADGSATAVRLRDISGFESPTNAPLTLLSFDRNEGVAHREESDFLWLLTPAKWKIVAGLVEPFAFAAKVGGFNWLSGPEARFGLDVGTVAVVLSCSEDGHW